MSEWLTALTAVVVSLVTAGIAVGAIKGSLSAIITGQALLQKAVSELAAVVGQLTTASAVTLSMHTEISRRVSLIETDLGGVNESIRVLRTRSHLHASKLMELDPNWRPYRDEDGR